MLNCAGVNATTWVVVFPSQSALSVLLLRKKPPVALMAAGIGALAVVAGWLIFRGPHHPAPPAT